MKKNYTFCLITVFLLCTMFLTGCLSMQGSWITYETIKGYTYKCWYEQ